ncbi:uncharacterized protein LOC141801226 [Halichoeres trimaculatus]|uniref:uncharacterized protein LOC141801226 n=1 Tax=Halichoeres trimaculatus TaxID=147232 RepID=UPI003D9DD68C
MTLPVDSFLHLQPKSGQGQHSQESGETGFSSTLEHTISVDYYESALPVSGKGSSVKVIPSDEAEVFEHPKDLGQLFSKPKSAEDKSTAIAITTTAQATTSALEAKNPDKETVKASPGTTAIIHELKQGVGGNCGVMGKKMKPQSSPLRPLKRRNMNRKRKRPAAARRIKIPKWFKLICMASLVRVSHGFPENRIKPGADSNGLMCFTCTDLEEKCRNLVSIYDKTNSLLYSKDPNEPFPACSDPIKPTGNNSCAVCNDTSNQPIRIYCPEGHLEVEGGGHTLNITGCVPLRTSGHANVGYIVGSILAVGLGILLVALLIYCVSVTS